jgi:hypothetical protein
VIAPAWPLLRFSPQAEVRVLAVDGQPLCHVVDGALQNPGEWRTFAVESRDAFRDAPHNAFPGPELRLPEPSAAGLGAYFDERFRASFDGRRTERFYARLSMVTRAPGQLMPWQWQPHVDQLATAPDQSVAASVLYLFDDPSLGGTAFYRPKRPAAELLPMIDDASRLPPAEFSAKHGVAPGYLTGSNDWFEKIASVPAAYNRLIVYSGTVFHSGDIAQPERLTDDPATGRLTINGFFTCRRRARSSAMGR